MRRAVLGGLLAGLLALAAMLWLFSSRVPPPPIPENPLHRDVREVRDCAACHGVDGPAPRSRNHPLNEQCFQCHLWPGQKGL